MFTYDSYLNYRLNTLKSTLLTRVAEDTKNKELEANYVSVAKSLGVYKSLLSSNNPFYNKLSVIYVDLPSGVTINELKIISNSFNLNLSSVNVISISQFIANLAKKPNISTVVLESATLNSSTGTYTVTLRGAFK